MIDLHAALGQQLLDVAVGQASLRSQSLCLASIAANIAGDSESALRRLDAAVLRPGRGRAWTWCPAGGSGFLLEGAGACGSWSGLACCPEREQAAFNG